MNKNHKLMAYFLASSIFLSGCKMEADVKNIINKIKDDINNRTSNSNSSNGPVRGEIIPVPTEDSTLEFTTQTTIPESIMATEPTIYETIEVTEPIKEENFTITEPVIEETIPPIEQLPDDIIVYANTEVNIRSSNTTNSLRIGSLQVNESAIRLLSYSNGWDLVKTNEIIGFVNNNYLNYSDEIIETEYKHTIKNDIVLTKSELNFRIGPSTNSKQILRFAANTELQVIAEVDNGWLLVRVDGVLGYVHGDYTISLFDKAREEYSNFDLSDLNIIKVVSCTANELNIRNGNDTYYAGIGSMFT